MTKSQTFEVKLTTDGIAEFDPTAVCEFLAEAVDNRWCWLPGISVTPV